MVGVSASVNLPLHPSPEVLFWHQVTRVVLEKGHKTVVVSVSRRSRDVSTVSSRSRKANVSVSAIDVSCPRPILQVIIIKLIKSVVAVNESLAELV